MNIKITKEEHELLLKKLEWVVVIGSHLYGTETDDSDVDYLFFYKDNEPNFTGLPNHHQFQHDDEEFDIDFIWTTKQQFMQNLQSGDSTINADVVMFTDYLTDDPALKLQIVRTYKIIRAFLGFANRDLKTATKNHKKYYHAARSIYCVEMLLEGKLPLLKEIQDIYNQEVDVKGLQKRCNDLRKKLNTEYEANNIPTYYVPEVADTLQQKLYASNNIKEFRY